MVAPRGPGGTPGEGVGSSSATAGFVLDALEQGGSPRLMLRYFEYWTLRVHGLLPDLAACALCGAALGVAY